MIKIDRSFVANIHSNNGKRGDRPRRDDAGRRARRAGHVEGIENEAAHAAVLGFGCAVGQGWYFGKPMTGDQAAQLLAAHAAELQDQPESQAPRKIAGAKRSHHRHHGPLSHRRDGADRCAQSRLSHGKNLLRIVHADSSRPAASCIRPAPLRPAQPVARADARPPTLRARTLGDDLRLFAITFAAGFLFVSILIGYLT